MGLHGELAAVTDPNRAASSETESLLRLHPATMGPALLHDGIRGAPQNTLQDELVDATFERPEELRLGAEDSQDLPGGSLRDPLNLDPGPSGPRGGRDEPVVYAAADDVTNSFPDLEVPWWLGTAGVVAVLALLAVAFGQLLDIQVGG
jgi:hypothetical protein